MSGTFWLPNVLRATTACNFSSLVWPDGSAPAALASLLFGPPEPQIIGKTKSFTTLLTCLHFLLLTLSFLIFFLLLFSSLALSASAFPSVHIVGSLTSKFPSVKDRVWSVNCEVYSWKCMVRSQVYRGKCKVQSLECKVISLALSN